MLYNFIKSEIDLNISPSDQAILDLSIMDLSVYIIRLQGSPKVKENKLQDLIQPFIIRFIKREKPQQNRTAEEKEKEQKFKEIFKENKKMVKKIRKKIRTFLNNIIIERNMDEEKAKEYSVCFYEMIAKQLNLFINGEPYIPSKKVIEKKKKRIKIASFIKKYLTDVISYDSEEDYSFTEKVEKSVFSFIISASPKNKNLINTLRSIQLQEIVDLDIVLIAHQSQRFFIKILEQEAKKDTRITIIKVNRNIYSIRSRLEGVKYAKGKYVLFPYDNYLLSRKDALNLIEGRLKQTKADILHFKIFTGNLNRNYYFEDQTKIRLVNKPIQQPQLSTYLSKKYNPFIADKVFLRKIILKNPEFFRLKKSNYKEFLNLYSKNASKYVTLVYRLSCRVIAFNKNALKEGKEEPSSGSIDINSPSFLKAIEKVK